MFLTSFSKVILFDKRNIREPPAPLITVFQCTELFYVAKAFSSIKLITNNSTQK